MREVIKSQRKIGVVNANEVVMINTGILDVSTFELDKMKDENILKINIEDKDIFELKIIFGDMKLKIKSNKIEIDKQLGESNNFAELKVELNDQFLATTFANEEKEALSLHKDLNENGSVIHAIPGYIDEKKAFISEGKLAEPIVLNSIVNCFLR